MASKNTANVLSGSTSSENRLAAAIKKAMDAESKVLIADVIRHDGPGISIAEDLTLDDAISVLTRKRDEENEMKQFGAVVTAFPYDGAFALKLALEQMFGYVVAAKCICGQTHNTEQKINVDAKGTKVTVPWGKFCVPGIDGEFSTGYQWMGKRISFKIEAYIQTKHGPTFDRLVKLVEQILRENSLYKGKVLNISFTDEDDHTLPIPEIRFVDVSNAVEPIFSDVLTDKLENDVMSYITNSDLARQLNGGTLKRGVLLAGPYGCGKTLTAAWVAKQASERGFTFIYVNKPQEFYDAHLLARLFQPAVIFVEDIEAVAGHDRSEEVNRLLNVLDGADSKHFDIMVIFTTNHGEKISRAMFRPGRMDITMVVSPPDAGAAIRLAMHYSEGNIAGSLDELEEAGEKLAGKIPATIQEAVSRARMRAVTRAGRIDAEITNDDLVNAANSIEQERTSFPADDPSALQQYGTELGKFALRSAADKLNHSTQPVGANVN